METTNVKLLNKLTQQYLNDLQIGEKDKFGNFVFSGNNYYADGVNNFTYTGEGKGFESKKYDKQWAEFKEYIDKYGVDDKLLYDLFEGFKNVEYGAGMLVKAAMYVCELNNPKYILKFLDFDFEGYLGLIYDKLAEGIINTNNAEYIKLFIKKLPFRYKHFCYDYDIKKTYKKLKTAYKEIVKSNKAGV